ncbi:unnamed protein product, partial [Ectocarpus sp. 4 AP-2014]
MKPKKQSSGSKTDIRSFFSLSPPTAGKSKRSSGIIGTPSTTAGTPPSEPRSTAAAAAAANSSSSGS